MRQLILLAPLALMACLPDPHEEISGRNFFLENCSSCHGLDATGSGPAAEGLDPRLPT